MENCNFPRFFSFFHFFLFFIIFLSFFIIFASSGAKIFQKMENCNFPRFFHFFIICLSFFLSFFNHFSSFLLPVVQKFSKKWKIAIFLVFFSFFIIFFIFFISFLSCFIIFIKNYLCFIIFASSGAKIFQKNGKLQFSSGFFSFVYQIIFHHFCFQWCKKMIQKMENCNFPRFFSLFSIFSYFLSFFIIFASVVQK